MLSEGEKKKRRKKIKETFYVGYRTWDRLSLGGSSNSVFLDINIQLDTSPSKRTEKTSFAIVERQVACEGHGSWNSDQEGMSNPDIYDGHPLMKSCISR